MTGSIKHSKGDRAFYMVNDLILLGALLVVLYPLVFIVSASFSSGSAVSTGRVTLWPVDFSLEGYKTTFRYPMILSGFKNTFFYMIAGTLINLVMTVLAAYPLSRTKMKGRGLCMFLFTFTMIFSGGLIPNYILMQRLHLVNTRWAMLIPGAIGVFNLIVCRTFFQNNIPEAAFRFGDYFFSEEISMFGRLGEPGTDYIPNPTGKKAVDGGEALFEALLVYGSEQKSHWQNRNPYYNFFDNKGVASDDPYTLQDLLWNTMMKYKPYAPARGDCVPPLIYTVEEAGEYNDIWTALTQYVDETRVRWITSGGIEREWDAYVKELEVIGLKRGVEITQAAYNRSINAN